MTPNQSFGLGNELKLLMRTGLLKSIRVDFPFELIEKYELEENKKVTRDRVYNMESTLLSMLLSALNEDKSLKQSVLIFKEVFEYKGV